MADDTNSTPSSAGIEGGPMLKYFVGLARRNQGKHQLFFDYGNNIDWHTWLPDGQWIYISVAYRHLGVATGHYGSWLDSVKVYWRSNSSSAAEVIYEYGYANGHRSVLICNEKACKGIQEWLA